MPMDSSSKSQDIANSVPQPCSDAALAAHVADRTSATKDIRKRRQMERVYHNRLRALLEVSRELSRFDSVDELCRQAIELGRSRLGFDRLGIWLIREDNTASVGTFGTDEEGRVRDERAVQRPLDPGIIGTRPARPNVRENVGLTDAFGFIVGQGWHISAEIWNHDRAIGFLNTDNLLLGQTLSDYEVELLVLYAATIGRLYAKTHSYEVLKQEHKLLRTLIDNLPDHAFAKDLQHRFLLANVASARALGAPSPESIIGKTDMDLIPGPHCDEFMAEEDEIFKSGQAMIAKEVKISFEGDETEWLSSTKVPIKNERGDVVGLIGLNRHITDRKRAENARRESEQRLRNIIESVPVVVYSADGVTGELLFIDGDLEEIIGRKPDEFYADKDLSSRIIHPEDADRARRAYQDGLASGRPFELEYRIVHGEDQHPVWVCARVAPVTDDRGRLIRHDGVFLDITKRKEAEIDGEQTRTQLLHSQKRQSLGTLIGGIAHDFNNMLTIVIGNAEWLEEYGQLAPDQSRATKDIAAAARQATDMTRSLQALSEPAKPRIQQTDANQLVSGVHRLLRRLIPANIEFRLDLDPESCVTAADPGQIQQVLINLCVNARDAMLSGGRLEIQTRTAPQSSLPDGIRPNAAEDKYVRLRVTDNGTGMDEATLTQAFNPFFGTKPKDRSSGLGLSVVHRIVSSHNGFVELNSRPDEGTCCDVYLPAIEPCSDERSSPFLDTTCAGGEILIIEDEEMVASLLKAVMESCGYQVTIAGTPLEGIEIAKSGGHRFCLAVVDYAMPEMTGDECIARIRRTLPDLKAIIITGYNIDDEELSTPDVHVMYKPFSIPTLLDTVQTVCRE